MKKLLLTLGTVAAVAAPVAAVVACGSEDNNPGTFVSVADLTAEQTTQLASASTISFNVDTKLTDELAAKYGLYFFESTAPDQASATKIDPAYKDAQGDTDKTLYNYQVYIISNDDTQVDSSAAAGSNVKLNQLQSEYKAVLKEVLPTSIYNLIEDHSMVIGDPLVEKGIDAGVSHLLAAESPLTASSEHANAAGDLSPIKVVYVVDTIKSSLLK